MPHTDPKPMRTAIPIRPRYQWAISGILEFPATPPPAKLLYEKVLSQRRTRRDFGHASLSDVANIVRLSLMTHSIGVRSMNGRKKKSFISSGALHPISAIILPNQASMCTDPILYDDETDQFLILSTNNISALDVFEKSTTEILNAPLAHKILLTADTKVTEHNYENAPSLYWRDAGAVLQILSMNSFAFGLSFCPLGALGNQLATDIHGDEYGPIGVGTAIMGG